MRKFLSKPGVLLSLLMLIFFAPGMSALYLYEHQSLLPKKTTNRGQLVKPALAMPGLGSEKKWRLVYWSSTPCNQACAEALDKLTRIRMVMGRRYYQVEQWLMMPEANQPLGDIGKEQLMSQRIHIKLLSPAEQAKNPYFGQSASFMIVSPDNFLVLTYKPGAPSEDLYHDLEHLLKNSRG